MGFYVNQSNIIYILDMKLTYTLGWLKESADHHQYWVVVKDHVKIVVELAHQPKNFNASSQRSSSPESSSSSDSRRIRGRGRGRGRGRRPGGVRARGARGVRGVGARRRINQEAAERVAAAREQRDIQLRETIATLEEQTLRNLVGRICERDPTFVFDILNEASQN